MSDYEDMTVAQLKELLRDAGLPVSGKMLLLELLAGNKVGSAIHKSSVL